MTEAPGWFQHDKSRVILGTRLDTNAFCRSAAFDL